MRTALYAAATVALIGWASAAQAVEPLIDAKALGGELTANVAVVSEYRFRGIAQSDDTPALQGGFDFKHGSGAYVGIWGSSVNFNDGDQATVELDYYGGIAGQVRGVSWDVGVIYYDYPGAASALDYDYLEFKGSLGYDFGVAAATGTIFYSPDFFAGSGDAVYLSGDVKVPVGKKVTLGLHVGHQDVEKNAVFVLPDYTDYSASLTVNLAGFDVTAAYIDTNISKGKCADGCDGTLWLSVSRTF